MAFPFFKLFFVAYKYFVRPINLVVSRSIKARGKESMERSIFVPFGQMMHKFEVNINRYIV